MKRKFVNILVLLFSMLGYIYMLGSLETVDRMSDCMVSAEEIEDIISVRRPIEGDIIDAIIVNEYNLTYDEDGQRWFYSLIEGDSEAYNPTIEIETKFENVKFVLEEEELTAEMIAENKPLRMIVYTEECYIEYPIVCTTLPIMELAIDGIVENEDYAISNDETPFSMRLFDNRKTATQRVIVSEGSGHIRGMSSAAWKKHGFRLSLIKESVGENIRNNEVSLLGMRKDDDWILYAGYNDQEKIRNVFSTNLWKESCADNNSFGVDNGVEYKYLELFIHGKYYGLYALTNPIDEKQLALRDTGNASTSDYSYIKKNWYEEDVQNLIFLDVMPGYEISTSNTEENWKPLIDYYINLLQANVSSKELIYEQIDVPNAIDIFLFVGLVQGQDNVSKNTIFTTKYRDEKYITMFTPWDMDLTWGNGSSGTDRYGTDYYGIEPDINFIMNCSGVSKLLILGDENIKELVKVRYKELRENKWSEVNIGLMLDEYEEAIFESGAFARDKERWPDGMYISEDVKLQQFSEYVKERLGYMDIYVDVITQ